MQRIFSKLTEIVQTFFLIVGYTPTNKIKKVGNSSMNEYNEK